MNLSLFAEAQETQDTCNTDTGFNKTRQQTHFVCIFVGENQQNVRVHQTVKTNCEKETHKYIRETAIPPQGLFTGNPQTGGVQTPILPLSARTEAWGTPRRLNSSTFSHRG